MPWKFYSIIRWHCCFGLWLPCTSWLVCRCKSPNHLMARFRIKKAEAGSSCPLAGHALDDHEPSHQAPCLRIPTSSQWHQLGELFICRTLRDISEPNTSITKSKTKVWQDQCLLRPLT